MFHNGDYYIVQCIRQNNVFDSPLWGFMEQIITFQCNLLKLSIENFKEMLLWELKIKKARKATSFIPWTPTPPHTHLLGVGEHWHKLFTYRIAGVHHSQETRGKYKMDTKQGKEKEENREEEVQLTTQLYKKRGGQHYQNGEYDEEWHILSWLEINCHRRK